MRLWLLLVLMLMSLPAQAEVVRLKELYLVGKQYGEKAREPLIDSTTLKRGLDKELSLYWNMDILRCFYWDNKIESLLDRDWSNPKSNSQFRVIGWNYQFGIRITDWFWVEHDHFSKHYLDYRQDIKYPVKDSIGFRLYFYRDQINTKSMFGVD